MSNPRRNQIAKDTKSIAAAATEVFATIYVPQYKKTVGLVSSDTAFTFYCKQGPEEAELPWSVSGASEPDPESGKHILMWDIMQGPSWVQFSVKNEGGAEDDFTLEAFGEDE